MRNTAFYNISNEEYQKDQAISKSDLTLFQRSPAHFKAKEYQSPTPVMTFGAATHTAILQPELYVKEYIVMPEGVDKRTKRGKEIALEAEQNEQIILSFKDSGIIGNMKKSIQAHKSASKLLFDEGPVEISGFWIDKRTGLECKCRPDKILSNNKIVVDLKTTDDARLEPFMRSLANYKYHWQAAHYLNGVSTITEIEHKDFVVVAVEKEPPYAVAVYRLDDAMIYLGGEEIKILLDEFKVCQDTDKWPAYLPDEIRPISLPGWYMKNVDL